MDSNYYYIIKLLDQGNNWYNNAFVENEFDTLIIIKAYKERGYIYQVWYREKDITDQINHLIETGKTVFIKVADNETV